MTPPASTGPAPCSGCTPRATTAGTSWSAWRSPTLEQLGEDTRETVNLAVAQGDRVVQVGQVDSQYMLGTRDWTEIDVPPHASALGKVLYAYAALPAPRGRLQRLTPQTVADGVALERQLAQARRRGWAVTVDELEIGLSGVAVPVRGGHGDVVAALGVSGPTQRFQGRWTRWVGC